MRIGVVSPARPIDPSVESMMQALVAVSFPEVDITFHPQCFLSDGHFAGAVAWDSLFHLPHQDQADMIEKIARWLEPGGAFLFNSGPAHGEAIGTQFGEDLYHASLDPHEYRAVFAANGLLEMAYAPEDEATGGRTVWLVRKDR